MNKVALITGSSRGIGRSVAIDMARSGFHIAVVYESSEAKAQDVVADIRKTGGQATAFQANIADSKSVTRLFDQVAKQFGRLDVVVNNAGVISESLTTIARTSDDEFDRIFKINARGAFIVMREAAKILPSGGRIINLSTTLTRTCMTGYGAYAGSKAAVETFTRILAKELGSKKITVNAVAPGATDTELFRQGKSDQLIQNIVNTIPLGRLGETDDISSVIRFLASDESGWVNGQTIFVNGGLA